MFIGGHNQGFSSKRLGHFFPVSKNIYLFLYRYRCRYIDLDKDIDRERYLVNIVLHTVNNGYPDLSGWVNG